MKEEKINRIISNKISFVTFIVPEFAAAYKMGVQEAFFYLRKYGAWAFLNQHWQALHTENPFHTVDYLYRICYQNGGLK